ncbi:MAG: dTDP-glucose 4,6-dehydratase [Kofleriaceae bacterium]|nr:dTDP-glucose 4,6-dehydratase [Kofleriaceae bacterium]
MILVTGGAGFIGSNFVLNWLAHHDEVICNVDALTYAGNLANLQAVAADPRHTFVRGDICDTDLIMRLLRTHQPRAIVHFAAESHVDRSIHGPDAFVQTNVVGTFRMLEAARAYLADASAAVRDQFRFLHVSTDEVYGSLLPGEPAFTENHRFAPNSPYSASKAAADHLVRSYFHTYKLPVLTSNCSNNYGPWQFPEKLIPLMIHNALAGKSLPVYGDGQQVRDWLFVTDHCRALEAMLERGKLGETYNVGGCNEQANLTVVQTICRILDQLRPRPDGASYATQVAFVADRPGHDRRYAIDAGKIMRDLNWAPAETFATGIRATVEWYVTHSEWVGNVTSGAYREWIDLNYRRPS